jgi:hypothetical protein
MPEKAKAANRKVTGNWADRSSSFAPHQKMADFWLVSNDKST